MRKEYIESGELTIGEHSRVIINGESFTAREYTDRFKKKTKEGKQDGSNNNRKQSDGGKAKAEKATSEKRTGTGEVPADTQA